MITSSIFSGMFIISWAYLSNSLEFGSISNSLWEGVDIFGLIAGLVVSGESSSLSMMFPLLFLGGISSLDS
jgi:hypothetical protein